MATRASFRAYIRWAAGSLATACLLTVAINVLVDPYGLFGTPRVSGLNALKPAAPERIRFVKPYYAERARPRTLLAGNSRVEMGLDPASPCWEPADRPVFNVGVPGLSVDNQIAFVEHAIIGSPVRRVLLGVDLLDFLQRADVHVDYDAWPGTLSESRINLRRRVDGSHDPDYEFDRVRDWAAGLLSLDTLADSVMTLLRQHATGLGNRRADGFNPAQDYEPLIRSEGQAVLFQQKRQEVMRLLTRPGLDVHQSDGWSWTFETLDRFLDRAEKRDIDVILFVNPYHAEYLTAIFVAGKWDALERMKRTLVSLSERHGVVIWDFNAIDARTTESPPTPNNVGSALRWFWEQAHYRAAYGELMLAQMLDRDCNSPDVAAGSTPGARLQRGNLDDHLAALRNRLRDYMASHPELVGRLKALN